MSVDINREKARAEERAAASHAALAHANAELVKERDSLRETHKLLMEAVESLGASLHSEKRG